MTTTGERAGAETSAADVLPTASTARTRSEVLGRMRGRGLLRPLVLLLAGGLCTIPGPLLISRVVDVAAGGGSAIHIGLIAGVALVAVLGSSLLAAVGAASIAVLSERVIASLRTDVVRRVLSLPLPALERAGRGAVLSRVVGDVAAASNAARSALPAFVTTGVLAVSTVVGLNALDWRLGLASLLPGPVWVLATRRYLRRSKPQYAADREAEADVSQAVVESVTGARTIRTLRLGSRHVARGERLSQRWLGTSRAAAVTRVWFSLRLNGAEILGLVGILGIGFVLYGQGAVSLGAVSAATLFMLRLFEPISTLLYQIDQLQAAGAALARMTGIVLLPGTPVKPGIAPRDGDVELRNVRYSYGRGSAAVDGLDLRVRSGEKVALVGASGAGKSTVAALVALLHRPTSGTVRIGGVPGDEVDQRAVGLVTQEVHVFDGTVAENLRLTCPEATEVEMRRTLAVVGALSWVESLPDGIHTPIGAQAGALSNTRAQQLALARILLYDPAVLIVDEPVGGWQGRVAVAAALHGRTGIIIAHQLSDARTANRVLVMDRGRIVEAGSHDELLTFGGAYAELWAAWTTRGQERVLR